MEKEPEKNRKLEFEADVIDLLEKHTGLKKDALMFQDVEMELGKDKIPRIKLDMLLKP